MKKQKKLLLLMTLILAFSSVLAACGADKNEGANGGTADKPKEQVFRMNLASDPPTLDPGLSQDNTSNTVINAVFEGLVRKGADMASNMSSRFARMPNGATAIL
jgi:oligopeptide transport system substrate-binding protein